MARLKVYTLGNNGFVSPVVIEAIGDRPHIRQASVNIVATSKAEAVRIAEAVGVPMYPNSSEFRQAESTNWTDSLLTWADRPMVLAKSMNNRSGNAVVEIVGGGGARRVGATFSPDHRVQRFMPDGA